jgi:hypothetical protein
MDSVGNATEGAGEAAGGAGNNDSSAQPLSQPADIPAGKLKPNLMLRLKSHNGATKTMNAILPQDETPTPTKFLKLVKDENIFGAIEENKNQEGARVDDQGDEQATSLSENPFDQQFKKSITPSPNSVTSDAVEPSAEKDTLNLTQADLGQGDETKQSEAETGLANDEAEVVDDSAKVADNTFKRPTDLPVPKTSGAAAVVVTNAATSLTTATTSATSTTNMNLVQATSAQQMPMLVLANGTQMAQPIASPTRLVMAQDVFGQSGQGKYLVLQQASTPRVIGK